MERMVLRDQRDLKDLLGQPVLMEQQALLAHKDLREYRDLQV